MTAVVLQGPANSAPEMIVGPFPSMEEAEKWAGLHLREGGYSVAQKLTSRGQVSEAPGPGLGSSSLVAFIPVTDLVRARAFYESTLGLPVIDESPFALVVDANATVLRITPVPDLHPQPFTIAGWEVEDIDATIEMLVKRDVVFNRYEGMQHRANGVWVAPGGDLVAWLADPDGNTLSLTQAARR
jgi:catechol 2,3-dioxygenase-like lactoylglutathione lyase family enzyme